MDSFFNCSRTGSTYDDQRARPLTTAKGWRILPGKRLPGAPGVAEDVDPMTLRTIDSDQAPSAPRSQRRKEAQHHIRAAVEASWRPVAALVGCLVLWWLITATQIVPAYLLPSPSTTWHVMVERRGYLTTQAWSTTYETILGFVIAIVIGIGTAVLIVYSSQADKTVYPLLLFAQVVPKIAIAPLFVVWLGFGLMPKVVIAVLIAFFPVVVSTVTGLRSIDPELLDLASTMGASPIKTFLKIRFPAALPHVFSGLKVAITLAVTGAVVGEFVGGNHGLGYVILTATGNLDAPTVFAALVITTVIGVVLFVLVQMAERLALPWHPSRRGQIVTTTI